MHIVQDILDVKGSEIYSIAPDSTVFTALKIFEEKNIGALLVMEGDRLEGIVTERDYARKVILRNRGSKEILVKEIMTPRVICIRHDQHIEDCMALMGSRQVRHLPVLREGRLVGLVSIRDVIAAVIAEKEFLIEQLENYITGDVKRK